MNDERVVHLLEEILKWTKISGTQKVKDLLLRTLTTDLDKLIYHFSDGRSTREVATAVGLKSHTNIPSYWKQWATIGLVEPLKVKRGIRYRRVFSLEDFGISIPTAEKQKKGEETKNE